MNKIIYILVMFLSFLCVQKVPLLMSVIFNSNEHTEWTLQCHPEAHWFGGSDGGFFLEIKHKKPPSYYVTAYNEKGSLLFKGTVLATKDKLNFNSISGIKNEYNENINSWSIVLKNNDIVNVIPRQEKEFLNDKM